LFVPALAINSSGHGGVAVHLNIQPFIVQVIRLCCGAATHFQIFRLVRTSHRNPCKRGYLRAARKLFHFLLSLRLIPGVLQLLDSNFIFARGFALGKGALEAALRQPLRSRDVSWRASLLMEVSVFWQNRIKPK
jgi:hypothetical protein